MRGLVTRFDADKGVGQITADDGARYSFHCTAILDGSRVIKVGTTVEFEVRPGLLGAWEATSIAAATREDT